MLPFPDDVIRNITYVWNFGDGGSDQGTKLSHTYKKMGSYLLTITADYDGYKDANTKPLLQAILITVLPNKTYLLPQAKISVDNKGVVSSTTSITLSNNTLLFSANNSIRSTSPIASYLWDFGDGKSSEEKKISHSFSDKNQLYIFPMRRFTDANGFISDTYVQLEQSVKTTTPSQALPFNFIIPGIIILNILIIEELFLFLESTKNDFP
ncbi:hypothetical protein BH09PAT1_BH09PAT1_0260 [soil metagenome]